MQIRKFLPALTLLLFSVGITLLLGEGVVRLLGDTPKSLPKVSHLEGSWATIDQQFGWVNNPGGHASFEPGTKMMNFEADHTRRVVGPLKEGAPELLLIGCSFTQGYGLEDQQTFASQLDQQLPSMKVVNFGTGGYSTYQSLLRLRQELQSGKDIRYVIYPFIDAHLVRNVSDASWIMALDLLDGSNFVPPYVRSQGNGIKEIAGHVEQNWPLETHSALVYLLHKTAITMTHHVDHAEQVKVTHALVSEMAQLAKSKNIPFLMVGLDYPDASLINEIVDKDVRFVDCRFPSGLTADLKIGGVGHPNEVADKAWAQCIRKSI
ncbi:MAG TPA: SGNH/GDSL hydrolase family protein [Burkholderiaceae bacterium]|jgi:hypothetical protein|nr:SGNH/GDSL hydrolase family protein [Burkholderiaceae bacterium]